MTPAELVAAMCDHLADLEQHPASALAPYLDDLTEATDLLRNVADLLAEKAAA